MILTKCYLLSVGETFNIYGSNNDALSLYQQLRKLEIVEVSSLLTQLEVSQDGKTFQSRCSDETSTYISENNNGRFIIYVTTESNGHQRNIVPALPKRLQEWLVKYTCRRYGINELEVVDALTLIFNARGSDLDRSLWEQGIVEVPFENLELKRKKANFKVRLPEVDEREPCTCTR